MRSTTLRGHGLDLAADIEGDGEDVVIFLHGGGQTRRSWGSAARAVAKSGRTAIALDLRGHGESDWSADGVYSLDHLARDLLCVIDGLKTTPALVGASIGGATALTAIGEATRPVASRLVLVDVTPKMNPVGAERIQSFMKAYPEGFETVDDAAAAVSAYLPHRPAPPTLDGLRRNLRRNAETNRYVWHWDPRFLAGDGFERTNVQSKLERAAVQLTIPTLLVRGARSDLIDTESVEHFLALAPHAECVDVGGAGHMVAGDMNDIFNDAVLGFLSRTELAPS